MPALLTSFAVSPITDSAHSPFELRRLSTKASLLALPINNITCMKRGWGVIRYFLGRHRGWQLGTEARAQGKDLNRSRLLRDCVGRRIAQSGKTRILRIPIQPLQKCQMSPRPLLVSLFFPFFFERFIILLMDLHHWSVLRTTKRSGGWRTTASIQCRQLPMHDGKGKTKIRRDDTYQNRQRSAT